MSYCVAVLIIFVPLIIGECFLHLHFPFFLFDYDVDSIVLLQNSSCKATEFIVLNIRITAAKLILWCPGVFYVIIFLLYAVL